MSTSKPAAACIFPLVVVRLRGQIPMDWNIALMLFRVRAAFNTRDVHSHKSCFPTSFLVFSSDHRSLHLLNAVLKGLKHATSNGCKAWLVWEGRETMSKPDCIDILTTSKVTCELCPSRIRRCRLLWSIPSPFLGTLGNGRSSSQRAISSSIHFVACPWQLLAHTVQYNLQESRIPLECRSWG